MPYIAQCELIDAIDAQCRHFRLRVGESGVQQHHAAVLGGRRQHPAGTQRQAAIDEFLVGQSVLDADMVHVLASGVPAVQAALAGQPDPSTRINLQSAGLQRWQVAARRQACGPLPVTGAIAQVVGEPVDAMQPQGIVGGEAEGEYPRPAQTRWRDDASAGFIQPAQSETPCHPQAAIRPHAQGFLVTIAKPGGRGRQLADSLAGDDVAGLQPFARYGQPETAPCILGHQVEAGIRCRIRPVARQPAVEPAVPVDPP